MQSENTIIGFFWRKNYRGGELCPFAGIIRLADNGDFKGEGRDEFGRADFRGKINRDTLTFKKTYDLDSIGATNPISYKLAAISQATGGGWKGSCTVKESDGRRTI